MADAELSPAEGHIEEQVQRLCAAERAAVCGALSGAQSLNLFLDVAPAGLSSAYSHASSGSAGITCTG
ncbi:hypothetical protein MAHJHV55_54360 [Mycobacterium avium subsp. hominissuis]